MIALSIVESTCVADSYTVVDTPQTPAHNILCPLHWVRNNTDLIYYGSQGNWSHSSNKHN